MQTLPYARPPMPSPVTPPADVSGVPALLPWLFAAITVLSTGFSAAVGYIWRRHVKEVEQVKADVKACFEKVNKSIDAVKESVKTLDDCVDRRFDGLAPLQRAVAELTTSYRHLETRLAEGRAERQAMHAENQSQLADLQQKLNAMLMEELKDLRAERRLRTIPE